MLAGILEPKLEHRETFPVWRDAVRLLRAEVYDAHQFERTPMGDVAHREAALDRFDASIGCYAEALATRAEQRDDEQRAWIAQQWDSHFTALGI